MNTLILDCTNGLYIALIANGTTFSYQDAESKKQSDSLLNNIDELLIKAQINIKQRDVIAVCVGPGSFTGIRVAIATAKGLAIGSKAKVVVFNSFESVMASISDKNFGIIVEGFGNNYYYYFKKYGKIFQGCATPEKLVVLAKDIKVYSLSEKVCKSISDFDISNIKYNAIKVVEEKIEKKEFVETNQIAPLYLRASQAEIERLKNGN